MQVPYKLARAFRSGTSPGLLLAISVSTAVFVATPISLPAVADRFGVSPGTVGLYSAAQLAMFVVGSWGSGRFLAPSLPVFRGALVTVAVANLLSALTGSFVVLVAARGATGLALGAITWLAWSQVFGDADRQGDIAVAGPVAGVVAAPLFGLTLEWGDDRHVFAVLAVAAILALLSRPAFATVTADAPARTSAVPQARVLIAVLTAKTLGGSAVFVYGGVIAVNNLGMTPFVLSLVYTLNAVVGIPAARWRGARPNSGIWLVLMGACAFATGTAGTAWVFSLAVVAWGFCFWAGLPGIFSLLAERSAHPTDRAGDAQAAMAAGRAVGPLLGGVLVSTGSFTALGAVCGAVMAGTGVVALLVEHRGRDRTTRGLDRLGEPQPART